MKKYLLSFCLLCFLLRGGPLPAQLTAGDVAPDFTVTDIHGGTHTLSDYLSNGQYVLLDFFFFNCGPCQFYTPQIELAYQNYGCNAHDIVFLGIDYGDNDAQVALFDQNFGATFPSVSGLEGGGNAVVSAYGIFSYPTILLIAPNDTIVEDLTPPTLTVFDYYFNQHGITQNPCGTAIGDPDGKGISLYPNPADSKVWLEISGASSGVASGKIEVRDLAGRIVWEAIVDDSSEKLELPCGNWGEGLYFVGLEMGNVKEYRILAVE